MRNTINNGVKSYFNNDVTLYNAIYQIIYAKFGRNVSMKETSILLSDCMSLVWHPQIDTKNLFIILVTDKHVHIMNTNFTHLFGGIELSSPSFEHDLIRECDIATRNCRFVWRYKAFLLSVELLSLIFQFYVLHNSNYNIIAIFIMVIIVILLLTSIKQALNPLR